MQNSPKGFNPNPYPYHHILNLEIESLSNLGLGIGRDKGWVIQVPFCIPGERVRARIFRNHSNYSSADIIEVLEPSNERVMPKCSLFGICGGCQYQHMSYERQLLWKKQQVEESFARIGSINIKAKPTIASPATYGYRSKLTPHYGKKRTDMPLEIGFLKFGNRKALVDVETCPIATDAINEVLPSARDEISKRLKKKNKGGTLLLRDTLGGVVTDPKSLVEQKVDDLIFQFRAGEFFQNNPYLLPRLTKHVISSAKASGSNYLVDAYCGGGLFALSGAAHFNKVIGIEISREGFEGAQANAKLNQINNVEFLLGDASSIFNHLELTHRPASLIIDPPRKGCDPSFILQAITFAPDTIVYVSCDPATQARDAKSLILGGYEIIDVQPFDLFPQTRHIENVVTFRRCES